MTDASLLRSNPRADAARACLGPLLDPERSLDGTVAIRLRAPADLRLRSATR